MVLEDLSFPEVLCFAFKSDNAGPPSSTLVKKQWLIIGKFKVPVTNRKHKIQNVPKIFMLPKYQQIILQLYEVNDFSLNDCL